MDFLEITDETKETVTESFDRIAARLLQDYQLQVNGNRYRLIDIEFYYYAPGSFEDIYAHKHEAQLQMGKWYFHGSGIDITFGNGKSHGGILIRGIAKISGDGESSPTRNCIQKEVHGPLNVKAEIFSSLNGVFERGANSFHLEDISMERMGAGMVVPPYIVKTKRIGLNPAKDNQEQSFYNGNYRYVIFPYLKLKNKTQIALDMQKQFPDMSIAEINRDLGSKFLKEEAYQTV